VGGEEKRGIFSLRGGSCKGDGIRQVPDKTIPSFEAGGLSKTKNLEKKRGNVA